MIKSMTGYGRGSTKGHGDKINVEICSNCHPYFTGKQNLVDTAGRIEKYMEKYNLTDKDLKK